MRQEGNDTLNGPKGDDYLIWGLDNDILSGGMGRDRFVLTAGSSPDLITDLTKGEGISTGVRSRSNFCST